MKYTLPIIAVALLSLTLACGCGKQEESAPAPKAAPEQRPASAQTAPAAKEVPVQKEAESQEAQAAPSHQKPEEKSGQLSAIDQALFAYLAKTGDDLKYADPRQTALIDLNGDGCPDALVLLENPLYFCGTGGCTLLVFKGTPSGFEFVSRSTLIRGPVLVSDTKTNDWRDLIVEVSGGGMAPKQVALKYTGSCYPPNPSTLPALPNEQPLKGEKIF